MLNSHSLHCDFVGFFLQHFLVRGKILQQESDVSDEYFETVHGGVDILGNLQADLRIVSDDLQFIDVFDTLGFLVSEQFSNFINGRFGHWLGFGILPDFDFSLYFRASKPNSTIGFGHFWNVDGFSALQRHTTRCLFLLFGHGDRHEYIFHVPVNPTHFDFIFPMLNKYYLD